MTQHKIILALLSLILLLVTLNVSANSTTLADSSCGTWVSSREDAKNTTDIMKAVIEGDKEFWILGYMTALAVATDAITHKDLLKNVDANSIYLWLDNYCKANPLKYISEGGLALMGELPNMLLK